MLALVQVCADQDRVLAFGGHPAISPLVHYAAERAGSADRIRIYQSEYFVNRDLLPEAAKKFVGFTPTPQGTDRRHSLQIMRETMIRGDEGGYAAAVFIGGMEGVIDEYHLFLELHQGKPCFPLASTGGAALNVYHQHAPLIHDPEISRRLKEEVDYLELLSSLLEPLA